MRVAIDGLQTGSGATLDLRALRTRSQLHSPASSANRPPLPRQHQPLQTYPPDRAIRNLAIGTAVAPRARPLRSPLPWRRLMILGLGFVIAASSGLALYHSTQAGDTAQARSVASTQSSSRTLTKSPATNTTTPAGPTSAQLQTIVNQAAASAGVPTGIVVTDVANGATASSNADTVFVSASIYKLYVADAIYHGIDAGSVSLAQSAGDTGLNVGQCLNYMITVSSNPCGEALAGIVGWNSQNPALHAAGFTHTVLSLTSNEQTSASDVALLLQKLYRGQLVSASSTAAFIKLLKAQQINNRLPAGLPAGTVIAHKTGDLNGLVHDAGIVYTAHGDYIVVALTGPWAEPGNAPAWFANFSSQVYAAVTGS